MAIDTLAKRFSILNFGEGNVVTPDPTGTIGIGPRVHFLGLYSGFPYTPTTVRAVVAIYVGPQPS